LVDSFTKAGVAHILALSGNNIELLLWLSWSLLYAIKNKKLNWIKYVFSLVVIVLYVYICLASPSLLRAGIMCTVFCTAALIGRPQEPYNQLCVAAFILLCYQPMWLFSIGFQLSFVAVLSLLVWYKKVYNIFKVCPWYLQYIWRLIAASMAAEIFLAPLVLLHFHSFPLWFLLSNILAAVVFPVIALVALMLIVLQAIPMIPYVIGKIFIILIAWPISGIQYLALHQPDSLQHIVFNISDVALWYIVVFSIYRLSNNQNIQSLKHVLLCMVCNILWQCYEAWDYHHKKEWILYTHGAYFHTINRIGAYYTLCGIEDDIPEIELEHLCKILICNRNKLLISSQTMLIVGIDTVCIIKPMQIPSSAKSYVVAHYTDAIMNYIFTKSNIRTIYTTTLNNKASYRTTARCLKKNIDIITLMPYTLERIPY
jgi:competence protein ComEC